MRMDATIKTLRQEIKALKDDLDAAKSLRNTEKVQQQESGSVVECLRAEISALKIAQSAQKNVDKAVETAREEESSKKVFQ